MIVEAAELQKFKIGANAFLLGVLLSLSFFKVFFFFFFFTFNLLLSNFLLLLLGFIVVVFFFFLSNIFFFLTGLSSLLGPLGFWHLALPVGVCSLECNNNNNTQPRRHRKNPTHI